MASLIFAICRFSNHASGIWVSLRMFGRVFEDTKRLRLARMLARWFHDYPGLFLLVDDGLNHLSFIYELHVLSPGLLLPTVSL